MELAIVLIFSGASLLAGIFNFKKRKRNENIFYMVALVFCVTVLILKTTEILSFDPTKILTELFDSYGLLK